jgi:hypothetical protein
MIPITGGDPNFVPGGDPFPGARLRDVSGPDFVGVDFPCRSGVGSPIWWVTDLSENRAPTQPLVILRSPRLVVRTGFRCTDCFTTKAPRHKALRISQCLRVFVVRSGSRRRAPRTLAANARTKALAQKPLLPFSHKNSILPRSIFSRFQTQARGGSHLNAASNATNRKTCHAEPWAWHPARNGRQARVLPRRFGGRQTAQGPALRCSRSQEPLDCETSAQATNARMTA